MDTNTLFSILIVDDDPLVIRVLNSALAEYKPLRFATSGVQALKMALQAVPDLVLLDVEMPNMNGFEVCKAFKGESALANVPIILITGHDSVEIENQGLQVGAVDFISKPPHPPLVQARVRAYQRMKSMSDTMRGAVTMDFLTGAGNRRLLEKTLTQELRRAARSTQPLALLLLEIESFNQINAHQDGDAGDACLRSVADELRNVLQRPADLLARCEAGTFAVLLPETDARGAWHVTQRCVQAIEAAQIHSVALPAESTLRLFAGMCCHDPKQIMPYQEDALQVSPVPTTDDMIAAASHAVRQAKSSGGYQPIRLDLASHLHATSRAGRH